MHSTLFFLLPTEYLEGIIVCWLLCFVSGLIFVRALRKEEIIVPNKIKKPDYGLTYLLLVLDEDPFPEYTAEETIVLCSVLTCIIAVALTLLCLLILIGIGGSTGHWSPLLCLPVFSGVGILFGYLLNQITAKKIAYYPDFFV